MILKEQVNDCIDIISTIDNFILIIQLLTFDRTDAWQEVFRGKSLSVQILSDYFIHSGRVYVKNVLLSRLRKQTKNLEVNSASILDREHPNSKDFGRSIHDSRKTLKLSQKM